MLGEGPREIWLFDWPFDARGHQSAVEEDFHVGEA